MTLRIGTASIAISVLLAVGVALGQDQPWRSSNPAKQEVHQALSPLTGPLPTPRAPTWWPLPPQHQQYVDNVLKAWEQYGQQIDMFESKFVRREFKPQRPGPNGGEAGEPTLVSEGVLKYKKPDKGLFELKDDRDQSRAEKWICDGQSIFQYNFKEKVLTQNVLPPDLRGGNALADGPVPFVFGAKAENVKSRYWIRPLRSPKKEWIRLEAWPRRQQDAADFRFAEILLRAKDMQPVGIQLHGNRQRIILPGGRFAFAEGSRTTYSFFDTVINDPLRKFKGNPFSPRTPWKWTKTVKHIAPAPPSRPPAVSSRQPTAGSRQ